jgi:hypothetical protein
VPTHKYARRWMNYQMMKGRTLAHCCTLYQNKKMMTLIYMWHVHTDEKKNKSNSGMCFHGPTAQHLLKKKKQAHPVLKKNGTKNGISRLKTGYRKYGRTNALPFSVPFPFTPSRFRSRFRLSRKKRKRSGKNGIRLRTKRDSSRPFSSSVAALASGTADPAPPSERSPLLAAESWPHGVVVSDPAIPLPIGPLSLGSTSTSLRRHSHVSTAAKLRLAHGHAGDQAWNAVVLVAWLRAASSGNVPSWRSLGPV